MPLIDAVSVPNLSDADAEAAFGRPAAEVDADWHRWARRGAPMGSASGFVPER